MSWIFGVSIVAWVLLNMATHDGTTLPHPFSVDVPTHPTQPQFPLLETMLRSLGRTLQPTYTCRDLACLFGVTTRTIQSKVADGTIPSRKLIGGARFLPIDIEEYLRRASNPPRNSLAHLRPGVATERITSLACVYPLRFSAGFHHHS
jgi:hypothetical protein